MRISDKAYDILVVLATYVFPAAGTLYFALAGIWGFPYGEQIVGTITAVDTFLAVLIKAAQIGYHAEINEE